MTYTVTSTYTKTDESPVALDLINYPRPSFDVLQRIQDKYPSQTEMIRLGDNILVLKTTYENKSIFDLSIQDPDIINLVDARKQWRAENKINFNQTAE